MISAAHWAWLVCILTAPLIGLCFMLDILLRHRPATWRRRVWLAGFVGCLLLAGSALVWFLQSPDPGVYWDTIDGDAAGRSVGVLEETGRMLRTVMPTAPVPEVSASHRLPAVSLDLLYLVGVAVLLLRFLLSHWVVHRRVVRATPVDDPWLQRLTERMAVGLGLRRPVPLLWHRDDGGGTEVAPAAAGLWRARVFLPRSAGDWTPDQQECVLRHELSHVRHRDNVWHALATGFVALQWFSPATWLALGRLREVSEMAADEVAAAGIGQPASYAATLVEVTRSLSGSTLPLLSMASGTHGRLARRIDHLLAHRQPAGRLLALAVGASMLLAVASAGLVGALTYADVERARGWAPQQYRWESADRANGLFVHGEIDLRPGRLNVGDEGLLLVVHESPSGLESCLAWRDSQALVRVECDRDVEPQRWIDVRLREAVGQWPFDADSPLAGYWNGRDEDRFAGSRITGIPGSSRNPSRAIVQAGWVDDAGARIGVIFRERAFGLAFRYLPHARELLVVRQIQGTTIEHWVGSGWAPAPARDVDWYASVLEAARHERPRS